jgi:RNA polymerase sigma factor (sigma-70 family)
VLANYFYYRDRDYRLVQRLSLDPPAVDPQLPMALRDAIGQLPKDGKKLYVLFYVEGLSIREIATRLERPEGTVKYLLHRLRQQVRRLLDV